MYAGTIALWAFFQIMYKEVAKYVKILAALAAHLISALLAKVDIFYFKIAASILVQLALT
jgi:hypothetical protein